MDSVLHIHLLGTFQLRYGDQAVITVQSARLQSLLAFALLHRQAPIARQQLAALYWPDTPEAQARTNLRNLIHQLRRALPFPDTYIRSDSHSLQWLPAAPCTLDVDVFEQYLAVRPGQAVQREALEQAVTVYGGDLLPGCYDDWIMPIRERLRLAHLSALEALARMAEAARDYAAALDLARRLADADPLRPSVNQQVIRLHALLGDRPAALKTYQAYALLLKQELGVEPDPEIKQFYLRLHQVHETPVALTPRASTPLVGRQAEWRRLQAVWETTSAGCAQMVFVRGEAGIGKSRLMEEFVLWAGRQGITTSSAYSYPAEGSLPYAPVVSWLRAHPLPPLEKIWLAEIARLLPEVSSKTPGLPPVKPLREAWQRQHLFEALARALLSTRQARLLVLEDSHWCDQDTLEWLHYLLRFDTQAPLLIVATERTGETSPVHPLLVLQSALRAEGKYVELHLKPLSEGETMQLVGLAASEVGGQSLSPAAAARIYRESEGNPLYVVEMVRLGKTFNPTDLPGHDLLAESERIQAVLNRRLARLRSETLELAGLAATIGREFDLEVLREASGENDERIVQCLEELLRSHIVQEMSADTYDFTHDRLRQALVSGLSSAHRCLLHRKVAEALLCPDDLAPCPQEAEIASHYEQARMPLPAVHHYRKAAESAARIFSVNEALRYLEQAIALAEMLIGDRPDGLTRADLAGMLEKLGDLLSLSGKFVQAQARFEQALVQPFAATSLWRAQVYRKISDVLVPQYQHTQALAALEDAEKALPFPSGGGSLPAERQEWLQIQLARSQIFYWSNQPDKMDVVIESIRPRVEAEGTLEQQMILLSQTAYARCRHERFRLSAETVNIQRRRLELAQTLDDPLEQAIAQFQYGFSLLWHGATSAALEWLILGYNGCTRLGATLWQLRSLAYLTVTRRKLGDLETLRGENQHLVELAGTIGEDDYYGIGLANAGWLAWQEGQTAEAEQFCLAARTAWSNFGGNVFHGLADWVLLALAVEQHNLARAEGWACMLLDPNPTYQPIAEPMASLLQNGLAACQQRDVPSALNLFSQALATATAAAEL